MVSRILRDGYRQTRPIERAATESLRSAYDGLYREVERIVNRYERQIEALLAGGPVTERALSRLPWWQQMEREIDRATARFVDRADGGLDATDRAALTAGRAVGQRLAAIAERS